jgi:hypothetical protein
MSLVSSTDQNSYYHRGGLIDGVVIRNDSGTIIVYDMFIRGERLYFISTFTSCISPVFRLKIEDHRVNEVALNEQEPMRYFVCDIKNGLRRFNLYVNGNIFVIEPPVLLKRCHSLAVITLFKHETGPQIQRFLEYYRMKGVDAFYLYYNGSSLPEGLPEDVDVFYRLWDFDYWNKDMEYMHGAQSIFLTMVRCRYVDDCDWLILVDLDEFIYHTLEYSLSLVDYLKRCASFDVVRIRNYWGTCLDSGGPITFNSVGGDWINRTKCIYKRGFKGYFAIHGPKAVGDYKEFRAEDLKLLHVVSPQHPERLALVVAPLLKTRLSLSAV